MPAEGVSEEQHRWRDISAGDELLPQRSSGTSPSGVVEAGLRGGELFIGTTK